MPGKKWPAAGVLLTGASRRDKEREEKGEREREIEKAREQER